MKAGIYTRVSTDLQVQQGESLDEQFHTAESYCKFKNIPIIDVYREEGKSGKNIDRPELRRLLRDCKNKKIDTVIVKKLDRLSRSILDFEKMLRYFEEHNIALVSLKENFDTGSPMSRAAVRIILVFAQLEREQTSERTKDAMKYRAERGIWNGGHIPLGYDLTPDRKKLTANEEETKVIQLIFEKYIELASYKKTAQLINSMGYRTKTHKEFIDTSIARIIQNPVYIGKIPYKAEVFSGTHQAIISEDLFNRAQETRKVNHQRKVSIRKENKHNFILEGLIKCGECNSQMTPLWARKKGKRYFYYGCTKPIHTGNHSCSVRTVTAHPIEQLVLNRIRSLTKDNELFQQVMNSNDKANYDRLKELREEEKQLEEKITRIAKKVMTISEVFTEALAKDKEHVMALELNRLDAERKELIEKQAQINIEANELENQTISREAAKETLTAFTNIYGPLSPYDKKHLMYQLIHSITYTKNNISIRYYIIPDIDILIKEKGAVTSAAGLAGAGSQRLSLGDPLIIRTRTFLDSINAVTYKTSRQGMKIRIS